MPARCTRRPVTRATTRCRSRSGHADPAYDALLDAADAAPTLARRQQLLRQAETRLQSVHAVLPLYHYTSKHLVHPDVQGFEANPLDRHPSRFLRLRD